MTKASHAEYERAAGACLAACAKWKADNPDARLVFRPLVAVQEKIAVVCDLGDALKHLGVAGNSQARKLLTAMHRATPHGATVLMAEYALEAVYGIEGALTRKKN